jgi:hypothetical protein
VRFMMLLKADKITETGALPTHHDLVVMGKYNEELVKAGALLDAAGLQPSSKGAKVTFQNGKPQVTDGPFVETKELIAGYWMIQVNSKEEAIEWAKRVPFEHLPSNAAHRKSNCVRCSRSRTSPTCRPPSPRWKNRSTPAAANRSAKS